MTIRSFMGEGVDQTVILCEKGRGLQFLYPSAFNQNSNLVLFWM